MKTFVEVNGNQNHQPNQSEKSELSLNQLANDISSLRLSPLCEDAPDEFTHGDLGGISSQTWIRTASVGCTGTWRSSIRWYITSHWCSIGFGSGGTWGPINGIIVFDIQKPPTHSGHMKLNIVLNQEEPWARCTRERSDSRFEDFILVPNSSQGSVWATPYKDVIYICTITVNQQGEF